MFAPKRYSGDLRNSFGQHMLLTALVNLSGRPPPVMHSFVFQTKSAILLTLFLCLAFSEPCYGNIKEMIWVGYDSQERDEESAILDHQIRYALSLRLNNIRIRTEAANTPRTEKLLKEKTNVCVSGMHNTRERQTFSYASTLPSSVFEAVNLYLRKSAHSGLLTNTRRISLQELLHIPELVFGVNKGRSYGQALDVLIAEHGKNLRVFPGDNNQSQLLNMALKKRIDVFLEYPAVVNNYYDVTAANSSLMQFAIEESQGFTPFYFLCSKSPIGKQFIAQIDDVVQELAAKPAWLRMQLTAGDISPDDGADFIAMYNQLYGTDFAIEELK